MEIKVLGSSSQGNCYTIKDGTTKIMLECGINYKEIQKKLNFNMNDILGCLLSHEHMDHSKSVEDILKRGIPLYSSTGTIEALNIKSYEHLINKVQNQRVFTVGTFKILPFDVNHDCKEPFGYLIESTITKEKLVFITDTYYCKYKFNNLNYVMVECNYIDNLLYENTPHVLINRILKSHMSLDTCIEFLNSNKLTNVKEIMLLHLSDDRSNEKVMLEEVRKATGKYVTIAKGD